MSADSFGLIGKNYYAHEKNPPYWSKAPGAIDALLLRQSVGERLRRVDARLKSQGFQLFLYDAWRPRAVQEYFHNIWTPRELAKRHPGLEGEALMAEVTRYWAAPTIDAKRPAPHATGAAVDLTITLIDGPALWMGSLFDDASELAHTARFESAESAMMSFSDDEARANRRLLYWLMKEEGFHNVRTEWWHYSWGDQLWAMRENAPAAHYGLAKPPPGFE
ncbi:MAG: M15 family metallopeptidase [Caulobacterales bacterium]